MPPPTAPPRKPEWGTLLAIATAIITIIVWSVRIEGRVRAMEAEMNYVRSRVDWIVGLLIPVNQLPPRIQ